MILFFNKNKDFISELSKDQLFFAEDEIKLNDQWVAEIGYPFSYNNKDFVYFGYFYDGNFYMYKIIENKNEDGRIYLKGIHVFFDEMQGHVIRDKKPKDKTVQSVCDDIFKEVDWNFVSSVQGLGTTNFYHISYLEAFDKILKTWDCEFYLEIKLSGGKISHKKVILKNNISVNHGKWFEYTSNLVSVVAEENHPNVFTAFIGRGKGEETRDGFGRKIKFDAIHWSVENGDPINKPVGQDYVEIKEATKLYGYPDGQPRITVVDFDEEDRENLLRLTYEYAVKNSKPKLLLKAKVYSNDKVEPGEIATIIRDDLNIRYQTKVIKINRNLLNDEKDIEVGDEVQSGIQRIKGLETRQKEQIQEIESRLEQALKNIDIDFNNEDGYNYDLKAGNKHNLPAGYYSFNKPIDENPTKATYMGAGKVMIADEKGSDGSWNWKTAIDGNGIYGSEIISHSITANKLSADVGQSLDLSSNTSITQKVSSTVESYVKANKESLRGEKGDRGEQGQIGPQGNTGAKGDPAIIYSNVAPTDTNQLWYDTNINKLKAYIADSRDWEEITRELMHELQNLRKDFNSYQEITSNEIKNVVKSESFLDFKNEAKQLIASNSLQIKQTSSEYSQVFERINGTLNNNKIELEKITGIIQSGVDNQGNTYTEWISKNKDGSTDKNKVRVSSDGIKMISDNKDTITLKDGIAKTTSIYVKEKLGTGNHVIQKYKNEYSIWSWIGENNG